MSSVDPFRCFLGGSLAFVSLFLTWRDLLAPFDHDVHHRSFWPKQLMAVWSLLLQTGFEGPSFISSTAPRSYERVLDTTPPRTPDERSLAHTVLISVFWAGRLESRRTVTTAAGQETSVIYSEFTDGSTYDDSIAAADTLEQMGSEHRWFIKLPELAHFGVFHFLLLWCRFNQNEEMLGHANSAAAFGVTFKKPPWNPAQITALLERMN
jgi:hypothetical protein